MTKKTSPHKKNLGWKFLISNVRKMMKISFFQFFSVSIIIGFLLLMINLLIGGSYYLNATSIQIKERLGMYFYLKDSAVQGTGAEQLLMLQKNLTQSGLQVTYYSKDQVLELFTKKNPEVEELYKNYKLNNPLPATMYVIFDNQDEFNALKKIVIANKGLISNIDDLIKEKGLYQQQQRIKSMLGITDFVVGFGFFLIALLVSIILLFLMFFLKVKFQNFHKHLEIEKLLGASYRRMTVPFYIVVSALLLIGFIVFALIFSGLLRYMNPFFINLLGVSTRSRLFTYSSLIVNIVLLEGAIIFMISFFGTYFFLHKLIKKI